MSQDWTERQRHANMLSRLLAGHLFKGREVSPRQIYGSSRLAWITNSYEGSASAYIRSTEIPDLGDLSGRDVSSKSLPEVAQSIAEELGDNSLIS